MKNTFTRFAGCIWLLAIPVLGFAQEKNDYTLFLNSGKYSPPENVNSVPVSLRQKNQFGNKQYLVIQFTTLPLEKTKQQLRAAGIELLDYIPQLAYTAAVHANADLSILPTASVRSVFGFTPAQKTVPALLEKKVPSYAIKKSSHADVQILTYEKMELSAIRPAIQELKGEIVDEQPVFRTFTVRVPQENLSLLADLSFIQWLEFAEPPNQPDNLPGRTQHRVTILQDGVRNLKGDGMSMGIWDGGTVSPHLDFLPAGRLSNIQSGTENYHGTHVAGTMGGRGLINPLAKGMAPNAAIYSYDYNGDIQAEMAVAVPAYSLVSSNHSYHDGLGIQCGLTGANSAYSLRSRNTDINLNNFPYHLHCHSAGNAQASCVNGWTTISGAGKPAKNNLVVANVSSLEVISSSSSFGPVHDGRIKPEISGMGTNVFSTYTPLNTYGTISGTSMSTPGITGSAALLAQQYKAQNGGTLPPSALIKNIICNTARDIGNPGPDYKHGFGRINALAAVRVLEENRYELNSVANGAIADKIITIPEGAARLQVMITWNDPAAAANVSVALVNNLHLSVISQTGTTLPWILDPNNPGNNATRGVDNVSNIEQVTLDNPPAGDYTIRVEGAAVTTGPSQSYTLTWLVEMPGIEVIYPNGTENFNPGSTETITWDNAGITSTQTVEYSLDNGNSWMVLSNTVPASVTRYEWTVPAGVNTSSARIRVSAGSFSDISDNGFHILNTPSGFTSSAGICAGQVVLNWNAVANATQYDLYRLDAATGSFVLLAPDITGTSYTATGLTPGATLWFTIRAKNSSTNAVSERAVAISRVVSSASCNNNCPDPAGLTVTGLTATGATLNWSAAATAVSYTVEYKAAAASVWTTAAANTTALSVAITGLTTSSVYDWRVVTHCTGGNSNYTTAQFTTTGVCPGPYDVSTNGTRSGAASIPLNTPVTGLVNPSGDNDYYRFVITTGGTITITLTNLPANYQLALQNSSGSVLQSSTNTGTANETINRTVTAGTYYARVYPSGSGSWNATNCYTLRVQTGTASRTMGDAYITGHTPEPVLFPNPVAETLQIWYEGLKEKLSYTIFNADGRLMMKGVTGQVNTGLDISAFPAGIYMVQLEEAGKTYSLKFVKK